MATYNVILKDGENTLIPRGQLNGIDFSNLIASHSNTQYSYTATKDCMVVIALNVYGAIASIYVNSVLLGQAVVPNTTLCTVVYFPLKKNQVLLFAGRTSSENIGDVKIYGIKQ